MNIKVIKLIHTIIWVIMAAGSFYILYAGITATFDIWLWLALLLLGLETITLLINKWTCPLTPIAMKYTEERQDNFDIYLPLLVAKYNKQIFGIIVIIGIILVAYNYFTI